MAGRFVCEKCSCSLAWGVDLYVCSRVSVDSQSDWINVELSVVTCVGMF